MKHKSQDVLKLAAAARSDARVMRTRAGIDQAFAQLLFQRPYRSVTVGDITRKAGVGRATFYAHYASKDELLHSQMNRIIVPLLIARPDAPFLLDCTALFAHVMSAPQLFRNIMAGGEGSGARVVRAAMEERVEAVLAGRAAGAGELPKELMKRFVVSTLLAVVHHGLQSKAGESAGVMQRRYARLAGAGLAETE